MFAYEGTLSGAVKSSAKYPVAQLVVANFGAQDAPLTQVEKSPKAASYTAPTEITLEIQAGHAMESQNPSFPDETTTVIPAAAALFAAAVIAGVALSQVVKNCPPPKLVLMTM